MVEGAGTSNGNGGVAAREFGETFKRWLEQYQHDQQQYQRDQEVQNHNINQLTRDVASLTSTVQSLVDNQKGLFTRANRPLQWGAIGTAFGLLIMMAGLLIAPMKGEDAQQQEFDKYVMQHLVEDAENMGQMHERTHWLMKLEERTWEKKHANPR